MNSDTMNHTDLKKLANQNLRQFHNDSDLADYIAFLFSELALLDSDWSQTLKADLIEMESKQ